MTEVLNEPDYIAQERKQIMDTLSVLKDAHKILKRDPELFHKIE